jgi:hypothetical protein
MGGGRRQKAGGRRQEARVKTMLFLDPNYPGYSYKYPSKINCTY